MISLHVLIEESTYLDKVTITSSKLYELLGSIKGYPTSSQPSGKSVENLFSFLTSHYDSVIVITVSKELSGTHQTITGASKKFVGQGKKITVLDSKLNSGARGLLVASVAQAIRLGKTHEEVVELIKATISKCKIFVSVHTLEYMLRSGRVSSMTAWIARLLSLKPVVSLDDNGKGIIFGKAFSAQANTKLIHRAVDKISKKNEIQEYCIVHASAPERAADYEVLFTRLTGEKPKYIMNISAITALSAGVGSTAVALITN